MSKLVNKVRDAISDVPWIEERLNDIEGEARAAIAAVAMWLDEMGEDAGTACYALLTEQLEEPEQ